MPARSLRSANNVLPTIPSTKATTTARAFRVANLEQSTHHSLKCNITQTILSPVERALVQHLLSDHHDYPAPMYRRYYRLRIMAPLTNNIIIKICIADR